MTGQKLIIFVNARFDIFRIKNEIFFAVFALYESLVFILLSNNSLILPKCVYINKVTGVND